MFDFLEEIVMERMRKYIILSFVFAKFVDCQETYCINNHRQTATNATRLCTLATPPLTSDGTSYRVNLTISSNESFWIGYSEVALSYMGCIDLYRLENVHKSSTVKIANPSVCYFQCKTVFIGVGGGSNKKICFCITSLQKFEYLFERRCSNVCDFPNGTLCGNHRFVSIYKKVKYPTKIKPSSGPEHCLGYEPFTEEFIWNNCSTNLPSLCMDGSGYLVPLKRYASWKQSMIYCINMGMSPASTSENFGKLPAGKSPFWIGTIRSFGICDTPESPCNEVDVRQGYLKRNYSSHGHYELHFGLDQAVAALCEGSTDSDVCSPLHLSTTTSSSKLTTNSGSTVGRPQTSVVAVYVAVPIALLLIAAVVGYILWRKRTRPLVDKSKSNNDVSSDRKPEDEGSGSTALYEYENKCVVVTNTETARYAPLVFGSSNENEYSDLNNTDYEMPVHHNTEHERPVHHNTENERPVHHNTENERPVYQNI